MADVDEDVIPRSGPSAEDTDLSDETQDFRFLSNISREDATIPKRGEKDFEPHATALQSNTLAASRHAMHNALAYTRVHQPKAHVLATYHPETNCGYAQNPKGPHFARMGHVKAAGEDPVGDEGRGQRVWLLPEEALYLLERGTVDVRWPVEEGSGGGDAEVEAEAERGLPMSLQGAYAMFLGDEGTHDGALTFERYTVYTGLKRMGYTVLRAPSWDGKGPAPGRECYAPAAGAGRRTWGAGLLGFMPSVNAWFSGSTKPSDSELAEGPLVPPRVYRSYADIYRRLEVVDYYDPTAQHAPAESSQPSTDPDYRITYHVWKPGSQTFKKSAPGEPDFRIAVVNARETSVPTLQQLSGLLETTPYAPPPQNAQLYQKLRHGYKNVILAVVDQGVASYLRMADSGFGREKLYERKGRPQGGKRGGGRGGRGVRGRGR